MIQNFFTQKDLPDKLPSDLQATIKVLSKIKDREEVVRQTYDIVTKKYFGRRRETFWNLRKMFETDIARIWREKGFYQCTTQNYLIRLLLVKSGQFQENEIKQKNTLIWFFSPHQYLQIEVADNRYIYVDPWSRAYGIKYDDFASGFHSGTILRKK